VRVELLKPFSSKEPAKAAPEGERHANGTAREDVDELIASLAESVGLSREASPPPRPPRPARAATRRVRTARPRILPRIGPVAGEVALYIAFAVGLGVVIGILAPRLVP
jgi:hypothetical protein